MFVICLFFKNDGVLYFIDIFLVFGSEIFKNDMNNGMYCVLSIDGKDFF